MGKFDNDERKALFLNLYNTCLIHGYVRYHKTKRKRVKKTATLNRKQKRRKKVCSSFDFVIAVVTFFDFFFLQSDGVPGNMITKMKFFAEASYQIGPHIYSLNDMEHGILRGKKFEKKSEKQKKDKTNKNSENKERMQLKKHSRK